MQILPTKYIVQCKKLLIAHTSCACLFLNELSNGAENLIRCVLEFSHQMSLQSQDIWKERNLAKFCLLKKKKKDRCKLYGKIWQSKIVTTPEHKMTII